MGRGSAKNQGSVKTRSHKAKSSWLVKDLTPKDQELIAETLEGLRPWLEENLSSAKHPWPSQCCADTCCELRPLLVEKLGNHGHRWKEQGGYFNDGYHSEEGHTWIENAAGWIVDPTAGQFIDGPALVIFPPPRDPRYRLKRS